MDGVRFARFFATTLKSFSPKLADRLRNLERALRPKDLVEQVRAVVFPSSMMSWLDTIDESEDVSAGVDQAQIQARFWEVPLLSRRKCLRPSYLTWLSATDSGGTLALD